MATAPPAQRAVLWLGFVGATVSALWGPACSNPCGGGCGICKKDLAQYCDGRDDCTQPDSYVCDELALPARYLETGCGYVRTFWYGDQDDSGESIYEDSTGELVYRSWSSADQCSNTTEIGSKPPCEEWADACVWGSAGAGGATP
jgi:hypothetical protein